MYMLFVKMSPAEGRMIKDGIKDGKYLPARKEHCL